MRKGKVIILSIALASLLLPAVSSAAYITCDIEKIGADTDYDRVYVVCKNTVREGSDDVSFFAVYNSSDVLADQFLSVATTAMLSGKALIIGVRGRSTKPGMAHWTREAFNWLVVD